MSLSEDGYYLREKRGERVLGKWNKGKSGEIHNAEKEVGGGDCGKDRSGEREELEKRGEIIQWGDKKLDKEKQERGKEKGKKEK